MRRSAPCVLALLLAGCAAAPPLPTGSPKPATTPTASPLSSTAPTSQPEASVLPSPTPSAAPTPIVVGPCPSAQPLSVVELVEADPYCFESRDVSVRGFIGPPPAIGWEPPYVIKPWRWPPDAWVLWQRGPGGDAMCAGDEACAWLPLNVVRGTTFDFGAAPGWVIVTGHRFDPAAETCFWDSDFEGPLPAVELAREECRLDFVLMSIHADPA